MRYRIFLPHHRLILDALVAAVLLTILGLTSSFFIQALVDSVFVLERKPALNWLGLGMLLVTLARAGFFGLRSYLLAHLSRRIEAEMVSGYHRHLLGLPLTFFLSRHTGIRIAISPVTLSVILDSFLVLITAGTMMWLNWELTIRSLQLVPALAGIIWLLSRRMKKHQRIVMNKTAETEAQIAETLRAIRTVKAFRAERKMLNRTEFRLTEILDSSFNVQVFALFGTTASYFTANVSMLGLLWFGGHKVMAGNLTVGQLMALHTMLGTILGPIEGLVHSMHSIQDTTVAADRMEEAFKEKPELTRQRPDAINRAIAGAVEFKDVAFRYGSNAPILEDLNVRIECGECVAIAGESGAGKTTLVDLLARFREPTAGRILIDGLDVRDYSFECLRREIAFVFEDNVVLNGTIADNIRLGRPTATLAEMRDAAEAARVNEFVARLPNGYETIVGEGGVPISAGERQRIAMARAILLNPSILVLDEPANHLDAHAELALQSVLDQRRGRQTTIVISSRPLNVSRVIDLNEISAVA